VFASVASGREARECTVGNAPATGNESGPSNRRTASRSRERDERASEMPASSTLATTLASRLPSRNRSLLRSPRRQGESFHLASIAEEVLSRFHFRLDRGRHDTSPLPVLVSCSLRNSLELLTLRVRSQITQITMSIDMYRSVLAVCLPKVTRRLLERTCSQI